MNATQLFESWQQLERRAKLMAVGTVLLVAISICLSLGNVTSTDAADGSGEAAAEDGVLIAKGAEPIPCVDDEAQLVASLVDLLSNEECIWLSPDDPLCAIRFTDRGFDEYYGDIQTSCLWEFYEIEVTSNTRSGVWRVTYPDGSTHDARFTFTHDSEQGKYIIESTAFVESQAYETAAFTSGDVLGW